MKTLTKEAQQSLTPQQAIQLLKNGNQRFINNLKIHRDLLEQVNQTADGQYPFAIILSCIDSRTTAELIFDQGLGHIFSIRIAGNILNEDILGSMEYGCKVIGAKLVAVIGHTKCSAIQSACDQIKMGNFTALLGKIKPAIEREKTITQERNSRNVEFLQKVTQLNIELVLEQIPQKSSILKELLDQGKIVLVGGFYDVETGEVTFYD